MQPFSVESLSSVRVIILATSACKRKAQTELGFNGREMTPSWQVSNKAQTASWVTPSGDPAVTSTRNLGICESDRVWIRVPVSHSSDLILSPLKLSSHSQVVSSLSRFTLLSQARTDPRPRSFQISELAWVQMQSNFSRGCIVRPPRLYPLVFWLVFPSYPLRSTTFQHVN